MKSGREDKVAGALDTVKGQVKKTAGALTGDEGKKAEGRKDQIMGAAKWRRGRTKETFNKSNSNVLAIYNRP
jgi:uncharacterized protein YjbJ (UPF0337 family)